MIDRLKIHWQWKQWGDLAPSALYRLLQLRQQVFIMEQNCIYPDIDGQDQQAIHLLGWADEAGQTQLLAYARLFLPSALGTPLSFGRVVVDPACRRLGVGDQLMAQILTYVQASSYSQQPIVISAQSYLVQFYQKFGFKSVGEPYDEDGIPHIKMRRD